MITWADQMANVHGVVKGLGEGARLQPLPSTSRLGPARPQGPAAVQRPHVPRRGNRRALAPAPAA